MKSEQVLPIMLQREVVAAEQDKLQDLLKEEPEQPESSEDLSLQQRMDKILDLIALIKGADKKSLSDYHYKMVGLTPVVKIVHETEDSIVDLQLYLETDWLTDGPEITAHWFTYAAGYGGAGLPPHDETISQHMVDDALRRAESPYAEKLAKDFSNLEWSLDQYITAARRMTPAELMDAGFSDESVAEILATPAE